MAVAASGGPDSTALLHCVARVARGTVLTVHALHVHHGLQASADAWVDHLRQQVARWRRRGLPVQLHVHCLTASPPAGASVEAWARRERYGALAVLAREAGCSCVLLAHHRRDQAETFLLQALRGGGAAALSAMPREVWRDGLLWCRPWLDQPREAVDAYLRRHRLGTVMDPSNHDGRYARSRLRGMPWSTLQRSFPDLEVALARAASRAQEEAEALREWTQGDLAAICDGPTLDLGLWRGLSSARRGLVLRAWLQREGSTAPDALVARLRADLPRVQTGEWPDNGAWRVVLRQGRLCRVPAGPAQADVPPPMRCDLSRPGSHELPLWGGSLVISPHDRDGIDPASLRQAVVRARQGGERFQLGAQRPARPLKKQFQALGLPQAERGRPLVVVDDELVFVPGLGIDARWRERHGVGPGGVVLSWVDHATPEPAAGRLRVTPG